MQKYDPGKKYNFLNMVPPWSNFRIDADDEIRSPELLTAYLKQSASFPQTFDTFHDYDGLMDALQKTEKGEGIKILGRVYDFMHGEAIDLHFRGCFSFKKAVLLDEKQVHSAVEEWLSDCKIPESIMGLSVEFDTCCVPYYPRNTENQRDSLWKTSIKAKSLKIAVMPRHIGGCRIVYSFVVSVQVRIPFQLEAVESEKDILEYRLKRGYRGEWQHNRKLWEFIFTLAIYGNALRIEKKCNIPCSGSWKIEYKVSCPTVDYKGGSLRCRLDGLYSRCYWPWEYKLEESSRYLNIVPLAMISGYRDEFEYFWKKYGGGDVFSWDVMKDGFDFVEPARKVKIGFKLKYGSLDLVLESLNSVRNSLKREWLRYYSPREKSCSISIYRDGVDVEISFSSNNDKRLEEKYQRIKSDMLALCDVYEKFLKSLYKNEPKAKVTCYDIVRRLTPSFCERIRKNPKLFVKSTNYYIADYAKSLISAN